jgi:hypothetical protein
MRLQGRVQGRLPLRAHLRLRQALRLRRLRMLQPLWLNRRFVGGVVLTRTPPGRVFTCSARGAPPRRADGHVPRDGS